MIKKQCELCNQVPNECTCALFISMEEGREFLEWLWNVSANDLKHGTQR